MPHEEELVRTAKDGDAEAFATLVRHHIDDVYSFLLRYTGDRAIAEDATQEAFIKAWRSLARFDESRPLRPWLFRIAKNAATDMLRGTKALPFAKLDDDDSFAERIVDPEPLPDELFAKAELGTLVQGALAKLPANDQLVLALRYVDDFSFEEIADIVGVPSATVRSIHHRALKKLRDLLVP